MGGALGELRPRPKPAKESGEGAKEYSTVQALDSASAGPPATIRPLPGQFLYGATNVAACPEDAAPEVAFAGRSNAGKSSTLNRLAGRRQLARTSKTPGRTQLINLFAVPDAGRLADLPGYGYARAPKARRQAWERAVQEYLSRRENLAAVVLVMDCRHALQAVDREVIAIVDGRGLPLLALLNKADKIGRGQQAAVRRAVASTLPASATALLFSATAGMGLPVLAGFVARHLRMPGAPTEGRGG